MRGSALDQLRSGKLTGSARLTIAEGLVEFPREVFSLADTLEVLDLSGNALSDLPDDLPRLTRLRVIFCSGNQFTRLPEVLGQCPNLEMVGFKSNRIGYVPAISLPSRLRWLILTDNQLETLPPEIGGCGRLQKLMLAGNRLTALPTELAGCRNLELLRIAANRLTAIPDWLAAMPRLAWLAVGGNPFCVGEEDAVLQGQEVAHIPWHELDLGEKLGEGASGLIHRASWRTEGGASDVAVKLFRGAVTSDGLPRSEMAASIHASGHTGLMAVHGKIEAHPDGVQGLLMPLLQTGYNILAGPPSFETCTRDVYPAGWSIEPEVALRIAQSVADAVHYLHRRGLMHGDLYAHNTLYSVDGTSVLGDCGAATFISAQPDMQGGLQRIEVRAFGCLLEELIEHATDPGAQGGVLQALASLRDACLHNEVHRRPLFDEIVATLNALTPVGAGRGV